MKRLRPILPFARLLFFRDKNNEHENSLPLDGAGDHDQNLPQPGPITTTTHL